MEWLFLIFPIIFSTHFLLFVAWRSEKSDSKFHHEMWKSQEKHSAVLFQKLTGYDDQGEEWRR